MSKRKSTIFESVQFLNEGFGAGVLFAISLPFIATISLIGAKAIGEKIDSMRIKKELENFYQSKIKNKTNNNFYVKGINPIELIENVDGNKSDINKLKYSQCISLAIYDNNDELISYCIYDEHTRKYGYNILESSYKKDKDIKLYITALYESKLGVYGDSLKSIIPNLSYGDKNIIHSKEYKNGTRKLSENEKNDISKQIEEVSSKFKLFLKSKIRKCNIRDQSNDKFYTYLDIEPDNFPDFNTDENKYYEVINSDAFQKFRDNVYECFISFCKNNGFLVKKYTAVNSEKYPYVSIDINTGGYGDQDIPLITFYCDMEVE